MREIKVGDEVLVKAKIVYGHDGKYFVVELDKHQLFLSKSDIIKAEGELPEGEYKVTNLPKEPSAEKWCECEKPIHLKFRNNKNCGKCGKPIKPQAKISAETWCKCTLNTYAIVNGKCDCCGLPIKPPAKIKPLSYGEDDKSWIKMTFDKINEIISHINKHIN